MTQQKSQKRRVRARMARTGERYTTARAQLLRERAPAPEPEATPAVDARSPAAPAESGPAAPAAGTPSPKAELILERTGRAWAEWRTLLDAWGAPERPHTAIARWLVDAHDVDGWWAQELTVTYERAIGRRQVGQQADGAFAISVSRTIGVPADRLVDVFVDPAERAALLPGLVLTVRTANPGKGARFDWDGGPERLVLSCDRKGDDRSTLHLLHERIADRATADQRKAFWVATLDALRARLES